MLWKCASSNINSIDKVDFINDSITNLVVMVTCCITVKWLSYLKDAFICFEETLIVQHLIYSMIEWQTTENWPLVLFTIQCTKGFSNLVQFRRTHADGSTPRGPMSRWSKIAQHFIVFALDFSISWIKCFFLTLLVCRFFFAVDEWFGDVCVCRLSCGSNELSVLIGNSTPFRSIIFAVDCLLHSKHTT